ncbi:MAG: fructosamine kinase family protein [Piscirickettsiaceae bacterium]|nr:fructosamine kinase family protein [Piscirickettsiaceae bacterium]
MSNHSPSSALLHGDLRIGNTSTDEIGNPMVFDPATYYSDRKIDIAMTESFGRFSNNFIRHTARNIH